MPAVRPRDAALVSIVVVAVVGVSMFVLANVGPTSSSPSSCHPQGASPKLWNIFSEGSTTGNFDLGLGVEHAVTLNFITPSTTTFFCVVGNFSASYATGGFSNATGNQTVTCSSSTPQCDLSVGVWTQAAWNSYAAGASVPPVWCYAEHNGSCGVQSSGSYDTGDLGVRGSTNLVFALWTETDWNPWGPAAFSAYVNAP